MNRNIRMLIVNLLLFLSLISLFFLYFTKKQEFRIYSPDKTTSKNSVINEPVKNAASTEKELPNPPAIMTPFAGKDYITLSRFNDEIGKHAKKAAGSSILKEEFRKFAAKNSLPSSEKSYMDFVKAKILFEASRDGGLWHIRWDITNQEPNSDNIWAQWKKQSGKDFNKKATAIAECDEISALYAFLCKKQGVNGVGLFWPTNNHTVAVWKLKSVKGKEIRITVPTTQIFLENKGLFGKTKFDPWKQPAIYDYTRDDISDSYLIPAELADFFIIQMEKYDGASEEVLNYLRYMRESVFLGCITPQEAAREVTKIRDEYLEDILRQKKENPDKKVSYQDIYAMNYFLKDFLSDKSQP